MRIIDVSISNLIPYENNPRKLEPEKFTLLQESIKRFGIIKPLIVNGKNNVLTAGHQRTRAIKALGIERAPVIKISGISLQDEIQFNLWHNSVESNKTPVEIMGPLALGYCVISPERIKYEKNENALVTGAIQAVAQYPKKLDLDHAAEALEFELNMEYPNDYRHNRHAALKEAVLNELKERKELNGSGA